MQDITMTSIDFFEISLMIGLISYLNYKHHQQALKLLSFVIKLSFLLHHMTYQLIKVFLRHALISYLSYTVKLIRTYKMFRIGRLKFNQLTA